MVQHQLSQQQPEKARNNMALDDYFEPEVAVTAVVTAALFSPRARKLIRRGAVYGIAGLLKAGDAVTTFAGSVKQGVQEATNSSTKHAPHATHPAKAEVLATEASSTNTTHRKAPSKVATEGAGG
ncbi:MAG: hypothetical protein ACRDHZ_17245 [Ktedonobacteraceae bacterium]